MGRTKTLDVPGISGMVRRLDQEFSPQKILLFGSYARGQADPGSDVDLIVVMPFSGSRRELCIRMREALSGWPVPKDILLLRPEELANQSAIPGALARIASTEAKVLHERTP